MSLGLLLAACGNPSEPNAGDAGATDAGAADAFVSVPASDPVSTIPCNGRLGFPGMPSLLVPNISDHLELVDVDVDNILDIVYSENNAIHFALGKGDGTFSTPTAFPVPSNSYLFEIGDMSGDGKPDLVFGGGHENDVRVAISTGGVTFATPQPYTTLSRITELEIADLNGDGKLDIIVTYQSGGTISVFLNTGSSFSAAQSYTAGESSIRRIALGDLTGDSRPELVATNAESDTVSVLVNNGNGTFAGPVAYPVGDVPSPVVLADLNADGRLDVVVGAGTAPFTPSLFVLLNQGNGVLGTAVSYPVNASGENGPLNSIVAGDVTGDGQVDLVVTATAGYAALVFPGSATGQLTTPIALHVDNYTIELALGDLNRDGRLDVVVSSARAVTPFLNSGTATLFDTRSRHHFGLSMVNAGATMTDLNSDGVLDVIGIGYQDQSAQYVPIVVATPGTASGALSAMTDRFAMDVLPISRKLLDVNQDNRQDVVVFGYTPSSSGGQALLNSGDGWLVGAPSFPLLGAVRASVTGDIDGDHVTDLVILGYESSTNVENVQFVRGLGAGEFAPSIKLFEHERVGGVAVMDLDDDHQLDLVVIHDGIDLDIRRGLGDGTFSPPTTTTLSTGGANFLVRDLNDDGKPDLISAHHELIVLLNNGDGTLAPPILTEERPAFTSAAFADFDGDGKLDIVGTRASPASSLIFVLLGHGDGTFSPPMYFDAGRGATTVTAGDVDRDGQVDVLVNNEKDLISVLRGRCYPSPP